MKKELLPWLSVLLTMEVGEAVRGVRRKNSATSGSARPRRMAGPPLPHVNSRIIWNNKSDVEITVSALA